MEGACLLIYCRSRSVRRADMVFVSSQLGAADHSTVVVSTKGPDVFGHDLGRAGGHCSLSNTV